MSELRIGKYVIEREIGEGGMGKVFRGRDPLLDRPVAVKLMLQEIGERPDLRERFFREARTAAKLHHPNIVAIYELGEDQGRPFIAMEYVEGADLSDIMASGAFVPFATKLDWMIGTCNGLHFAHKNTIIHRDVKPGNIRIDPEGVPKVLDFGLAKFQVSDHTRTGTVMGTPDYMAPEQVRGVKHVDGRCDLWAVGVMLYRLVSGEKPFAADSHHAVTYRIVNEPHDPLVSVVPGCGPELVRIIDRCLAKRPEDRWASCQELAQALSEFKLRLPEEERALEERCAALGRDLQARKAEWEAWKDQDLSASDFEPPPPGPDAGDYLALLARHAQVHGRVERATRRLEELGKKLDEMRRKGQAHQDQKQW